MHYGLTGRNGASPFAKTPTDKAHSPRHLLSANNMRLIIISGRSGSGKSTALHVLEDEGFYCVDNMPAALLLPLVNQMHHDSNPSLRRVAVSIDARNATRDLATFPDILQDIQQQHVDCEVLYLDANDTTLIKRFSETRRKHPLSDNDIGLPAALVAERRRLEPIADLAALTIDTSTLTLYELRDCVASRVAGNSQAGMSLQFLSFGYKHGIPIDADIVLDARCLPNPYWKIELRPFSGLDEPVKQFLGNDAVVQDMLSDIGNFLDKWLAVFRKNRRYMTVAIGCTGGHHRSVFICEQLRNRYNGQFNNIQVRHREINQPA